MTIGTLPAALFASPAFLRFAGAAVRAAPIEAEERQELLGALARPDRLEESPGMASSLEGLLAPHTGAMAMLLRQVMRFGRGWKRDEEFFDVYLADDRSLARTIIPKFPALRADRLPIFIDAKQHLFVLARTSNVRHERILEAVGAASVNNFLGLISASLFVEPPQQPMLIATRSAFKMTKQQISDTAWLQAAQMVAGCPAFAAHAESLEFQDASFILRLSTAPLSPSHRCPLIDQRTP